MPHIKIKKGHSIKIAGLPDKNISTSRRASSLAILMTAVFLELDFRFLTALLITS